MHIVHIFTFIHSLVFAIFSNTGERCIQLRLYPSKGSIIATSTVNTCEQGLQVCRQHTYSLCHLYNDHPHMSSWEPSHILDKLDFASRLLTTAYSDRTTTTTTFLSFFLWTHTSLPRSIEVSSVSHSVMLAVRYDRLSPCIIE